MQDYSRYRSTSTRLNRSAGERFLNYLRTRSTETWVFFAAGLFLGALIG
jgi:hypothetical protein